MKTRRAFKQSLVEDSISMLSQELIDISKKLSETDIPRNQKTYDRIRMELKDIIGKLEWISNTKNKMREACISIVASSCNNYLL